jgi:hypothetical protein
MMVMNQVDFDMRILDDIERDIKALPQRYRTEFNKETRKPIKNLRRRVGRVPARKPTLPFKWSKNREAQGRASRWYFAAVAGKIPGVRIPTSGGRYKRQNKLLEKLKIRFNRKERTITAEGLGKEDEAWSYVIGPRQVPSHKRTGWKRVDKELDRAAGEFLDVSIRVWDKITDEVGQ